MKFLGLEIQRAKAIVAEEVKDAGLDIGTIMERIEAVNRSLSGVSVTPESCEQSPTVKAIVTAVTRRFQSMPADVYQTGQSQGRETKEYLPNHPVTRLLKKPNNWQSRVDYWGDASSALVRYGRYAAFKARGETGPIRRLLPICPSNICVERDRDWQVTYKVTENGKYRVYQPEEVHYVRGPSRNFLEGDSPITDIREAIALDIAVEKFGASFFGNGAMPLLIFKVMQGFQAMKSPTEEKQFIESFSRAYGGAKKHGAMVLPKGMEIDDSVKPQNDQSQFIETRKYQRTVIAGAFGVPPHLVGDLERGTFNNVEQQSLDFVTNVILPYCRVFEAAMERDLLTDDDRSGGIIIRFNIDAALRADIKTRFESYQLALDRGVFSPNEVREMEGHNPISPDDGGDDYVRPLNMGTAEQAEKAAAVAAKPPVKPAEEPKK